MDKDRVLLGDCKKLGKEIEDNSIDIIITDPPYLEEYLPLYRWLAKFSARVLKPGSYMISYGAGMFIPEVIKELTVPGLDYFWLEILIHGGGYPRVWSRNLMSAYKPIFVYTKGKPRLNPWRATIHRDQRDKRYHEWGQGSGLTTYFLDLLTDPEDTVMDPFAGGGSFLSAAKAMGRHYIGFEKDPDAFKIVTERLASEQFPLFATPRLERQLSIEWIMANPVEED